GRQAEVQRGRHLLRRGAARAGIGHGKRERDAVRRVEEVAGRLAQRLVQVEGEGAIARGECRQVGGCDGGGRGGRVGWPDELRGGGRWGRRGCGIGSGRVGRRHWRRAAGGQDKHERGGQSGEPIFVHR